MKRPIVFGVLLILLFRSGGTRFEAPRCKEMRQLPPEWAACLDNPPRAHNQVALLQSRGSIPLGIYVVMDQRIPAAVGGHPEALDLTVGEGFQAERESRGKGFRFCPASSRLSGDLIGHEAMYAHRPVLEAREDQPRLKAFHDAMPSLGSPPHHG